MRRTLGKVLAFWLALVVCVSSIDMRVFATGTSVSESAQGSWDGITTEAVYVGENCKVIFTLTDYWESGYNANIKIENTSDSAIENWCLSFGFENTIENIWNAEIYKQEDNKYFIKNAGWNQDIAVGESVEVGFGASESFWGFPSKYELRGGNIGTKEEGYSIDYYIDNDWESGFSANVTIHNLTEQMIEDWQLSFHLDNEITSIWNGEIVSHEGNHYVVKNGGHNQNISADSNVQFGFVVENGTSANELYDVVLEASNIDIESNVGTDEEEGGDMEDSSEESEEDGTEDSTEEGEVDDAEDSTEEGEVDDTEDSTEEGEADDTEDSTEEDKEGATEDGPEEDKESVDTSDDDGDMLNNFFESYYGTDSNVSDTDNDGLSDYEEVVKLGTDPLKQDTDGDSIADGEEDFDKDGLSAKQELVNGTNPTNADTDEDGLFDGDEVYIYSTNPLIADTDSDGLKDGEDVKLSFDPTRADTDNNGILDGNEMLAQEITVPISNENKAEVIGVSVSMECAGDIEAAVSITDMYGIDTYSSDVVGLIGVPIEINSVASFETATITFRYDKEMLGETKEEDLCILWYDEANKRYVLLEDSIVDTENHTVSYTTEHFSTYMLIDRELWQATWEHKIDYTVKPKEVADASYDIVVCFDYSVNEEEFADAKLFVESIIQQMESGDRIKFGVYAPNTWNTYSYANWITNKSVALRTLSTLEKDLYDNFGISLKGNYYSENYQAIGMLADMTDKSSTNNKVGFLVNAGKNEDVTRYIILRTKEQAEQDLRALGYPVRAVSVTKEMNEELDELLKKYEGNSYDSDSMWDIERKYGYDVPGKDELDSDGDGLLDVYEINGIRLSNGQVIYTDAQYVDSDGDGLSDYEELGGLQEAEIIYRDGTVYTCKLSYMNSHPLKEDTDGDDISDEEEFNIGTNPMSKDTDGDGLHDGIELTNWFDPLEKDPDGDGRLDFQEYVDGTDPFSYNKSWDEHVGDFTAGFFAGDFIQDSDSVATTMGQIVSSFIPFVDARDVLANLVHEDYAFAGLSAIGLVPIGGDVTKAVGKVGKFAVKNVDDIPKVAIVLEFLNKNCPDVVKMLGKNEDFVQAAKQLSKADNIKLTRKQAYAITEAFENAGLSHYLMKTSNSLDIKSYLKAPDGVWEKGAIKRGNELDEVANNHLSGKGLGVNFPVVDRIENMTLVSTKSLDIASTSYQNPNRIKNILNRYKDSLEGFEKKYFKGEDVFEWGKRILNRSEYDKKALEIILPDVIITEDVLKVLNEFKKTAKEKGIEIWYVIAK